MSRIFKVIMWIYVLYCTSSKVSSVQAIIIDPHNNQVQVALIAQLVAQYYTGITEEIDHFKGTPLFGLYRYVPLDRVWFFGLTVLNRVYNLTCLCPKQV